MPTTLTETHIAALARLRGIVSLATLALWNALPNYDEASVEPFVTSVVPVVTGGQLQAVALTEAFLARMQRRTPIGVNPDALIGANVRAGAPPEEVYRRPFVNVWTALSKGTSWEEAVNSGRARALATAELDVQLSSRATFQAVQDADDGIYGYRRVADAGACSYCLAINGAYVKSADASPLHNRCGCGLEPLTRPHPRATYLPSGTTVRHDDYALHQHGEVGSVIGDPQYAFAGPQDIDN